MGQTLTHGIYLPDEGERNCYNGLAANWSILDGAVGTIAEHTTALSGKAPLVHTHTKSDITDFPAYGNAAGTICEGNDSRLSDARTPVAHTHGKADVTDLLNSNFIPSANNSYNLGSSSYQWNNLYAKAYYYNGVAWGLDKENVWSANQKIANNPSYLYLKNASMTQGTAPASNKYSGVVFQDSNNTELGNVTYKKHKNSNNVLVLNVKNTDGTNNYECFASLSLTPSGSASFYPEGADCNLGQATTPWKTLNGVNPGALCLPDYSKSMNVDTTGWSTSAGRINYTPTVNGWLQIAIPNDIDNNNNEKSNFITIMDTDIPNVGFNNPSGISAGNTNDYRIQITFPVVANKTYYIYIKSYSGNIYAVKYIPALGHI